MKSTTQFAIVAILVLSVLLFAGCVNNSKPYGDTTIPPAGNGGQVAAPTTDTVAQDLSGSTGTTSNDITTSDLDSLQNDLDNIDTDVDGASQSSV